MVGHSWVAGLWAAGLACVASAFNCPPVKYQDNAVSIEIADGRVFIPVYRHEPANKKPKVLVIGLHGAGRNGDNYFGWITGAMTNAGLSEDVAVLVPVFANFECKAKDWSGHSKYTGDAVMWSHSTRQWVFGQRSDHEDDWQGISSYQVIDDLIAYAEDHYSSVRKIVVTGFSAGAQMGLRWSVFSPQGVQGKSLAGVPLTIILGSPSSVTYLSPERPAKSCRRDGSVTVTHRCKDFVEPDDAHYKTCHGHWDRYAFGIDGLDWEDEVSGTIRGDVADYLHQFIKDDNLVRTTLLQRFGTKDMVFQFGDSDTKQCGIGACADDCSAMLEGQNRLQRGLNFMSYLEWVLPGYKAKFSTFHGGHRPELFFAGDFFNEHAFNTKGWDECLWDSMECFSLLMKLLISGAVVLTTVPAICVFIFMQRHRDKHYVKVMHKSTEDLEQAKAMLKRTG